MGEISINPKHNVHKKYREVIYINPFLATPPVVVPVANTFIGGVASTLYTPALLATKLAIDVSRISAFEVVGSDIKCKIVGSYTMPYYAFINDSLITYYEDSEGLVTSLSGYCFRSTTSLIKVNFPNVVSVFGVDGFTSSKVKEILLPNAINISDVFFYGLRSCDLYIPKVVNLGTTTSNNSVFSGSYFKGLKIYTNTILKTNNSGGVDGDISELMANGSIITYVENFNLPNKVLGLNVVYIYESAVKISFSNSIGSVNTIDYYKLYVNGVYIKKIKSGEIINNLNKNSNSIFSIVAVDIYYNHSQFSDSITVQTGYNLNKDEANSFIIAANINDSVQITAINQLTLNLKNNGIFFKLKSLNVKVGGSAEKHKFNLIDARNLDSSFRYTYLGSWIHNSYGSKANGANTYANTHFNIRTNNATNSVSYGYYITQANTLYGDVHGFGAYDGGNTKWFGIQHQNASTLFLAGYEAASGNSMTIEGSNNGFFAATINGEFKKLYHKNTKKEFIVRGENSPNINLFEGALNLNNSYYSGLNATFGTSFIGEGLTDSEIQLLQAAIISFETALGRNV